MKKHLSEVKYKNNKVKEEFVNLIETVNYYFFTDEGHKEHVNIHELLETIKVLHMNKEYVRECAEIWKSEVNSLS